MGLVSLTLTALIRVKTFDSTEFSDSGTPRDMASAPYHLLTSGCSLSIRLCQAAASTSTHWHTHSGMYILEHKHIHMHSYRCVHTCISTDISTYVVYPLTLHTHVHSICAHPCIPSLTHTKTSSNNCSHDSVHKGPGGFTCPRASSSSRNHVVLSLQNP